MHCLTSQGNWELRIDYQLKNGTKSYLHYNKFAIGSAEDQYPLNISGFDSTGLQFIYSYICDAIYLSYGYIYIQKIVAKKF